MLAESCLLLNIGHSRKHRYPLGAISTRPSRGRLTIRSRLSRTVVETLRHPMMHLDCTYLLQYEQVGSKLPVSSCRLPIFCIRLPFAGADAQTICGEVRTSFRRTPGGPGKSVPTQLISKVDAKGLHALYLVHTWDQTNHESFDHLRDTKIMCCQSTSEQSITSSTQNHPLHLFPHGPSHFSRRRCGRSSAF